MLRKKVTTPKVKKQLLIKSRPNPWLSSSGYLIVIKYSLKTHFTLICCVESEQERKKREPTRGRGGCPLRIEVNLSTEY